MDTVSMATSVKWGDLGVRTTVGVVLILVGALEIWLGGIAFKLLGIVIAGLIAKEWYRLIGWSPAYYFFAALVAALFVAVAVWLPPLFSAPILIGMILLGFSLSSAWLLGGFGVIYATIPILALIWLREQEDGFLLVSWLVAAVVAVDIGAYFTGRMIGGPKLAPKFSPNKTWAGLLGGVVLASVVGACFSFFGGIFNLSFGLATSALLGIVAQAGDVGESALKRAYGVKDTGAILPGHGGVMDRLDGLIAVAPLAAFVLWCVREAPIL